MSDKKLFVPDRIKVGFNKRNDTYTGKLAYVIYFDKKGVLHKEKSWQGWRDKHIAAQEFDNEPTDGFVLNKGVGGQRESYGWNARNEYIRVYDSRGFEFEISVANLLFILRECDCSRGKGLEGQFVYAWDRDKLVLLPVNSQEYKNSKSFTALQDQVVKAKELVAGATYTTKKLETLVYLGKFDYYFLPGRYNVEGGQAVGKRFVFWNGKAFVVMKNIKSLAIRQGDDVDPHYADRVDSYNKSARGSKVVGLFTKKIKEKPTEYGYTDTYHIKEPDGSYTEYQNYWNSGKVYRIVRRRRISLVDGRLVVKSDYHDWYTDKRLNNGVNILKEIVPTEDRLYVELESGKTFKYEDSLFREE